MFKDKETNEFNTWGSDTLTCPHCGYKDPDGWEVAMNMEDESEKETECGVCSKKFTVTIDRSVKYTTHCDQHKLIVDQDEEPRSIAGKMCRYYQCETCEFTDWMTQEEATECSQEITEAEKWNL